MDLHYSVYRNSSILYVESSFQYTSGGKILLLIIYANVFNRLSK